MKRALIVLMGLCVAWGGYAQKKNFSYTFYGQVRGDLFYNSRANSETVDGLFYLYPKDRHFDAAGKDLNASPNGSFYVLYSRLGVDVQGPGLGTAKTTVKLEADFRGSGSTYTLFRIRHAYINLDWGKSDVTIGQTWHPLFGEVTPQVLNLNVGAPFQPFNRSPLIRYRYENNGWQLAAAAVWQLQYLSAGPNGKSEEYIKNGCVPELYAGVNYKKGAWLVGGGVEMVSLKPRTQAEVNKQTFKVSERITTFSPEVHAKYQSGDWMVAAKTILAANLTQCSMLGGYAVTSVNPSTGEQKYTPFRHSSSWLNITYGKKWQPGVYLGYLKNLGTTHTIHGDIYGVGVGYGNSSNVDQLVSASAQLTYNLPHWKIGAEYTCASAYFGVMGADGKVRDTHAVTNHRILGVVMFLF